MHPSDSERVKPNWPVAIGCVIVSLIAATVECWMIYRFVYSFRLSSWPTADAEILKSEVRSELGAAPRHTAEISYRFVVNDVNYESTSIRVRGTGSKYKSDAQAIVDRFQPGLLARAYYNSSDPRESYLLVGVDIIDCVLIVTPLMIAYFFGAAGLTIARGSRDTRVSPATAVPPARPLNRCTSKTARDMGTMLDELRDRLGRPPRRFGFIARWRLRRRPPSVLPRDDDLMEVYRRQQFLLSEGEVVWGTLVQANNLLFRAGGSDLPAMAVYGRDKYFDTRADQLQEIAQRLFSLKHTTPDDPQERRFAELISDEMERAMGWAVPPNIAGGREVRCAVLMIFRIHIPGGILRSGWFPLLVSPETPAVMIVPHRFWSAELIRTWTGRE